MPKSIHRSELHEPDHPANAQPEKQAYHSPELRDYGTLVELTQTSNGTLCDTAGCTSCGNHSSLPACH